MKSHLEVRLLEDGVESAQLLVDLDGQVDARHEVLLPRVVPHHALPATGGHTHHVKTTWRGTTLPPSTSDMCGREGAIAVTHLGHDSDECLGRSLHLAVDLGLHPRPSGQAQHDAAMGRANESVLPGFIFLHRDIGRSSACPTSFSMITSTSGT